MTLLNRTTVDQRLLAIPQWVVDTNALMLPSVGCHGVWRHALPNELQKAIEEDRFSEVFLYDMQLRMDNLLSAVSGRAAAGDLALGYQQDREIIEAADRVCSSYREFKEKYGYCPEVKRLYETQCSVLEEALVNGTEYEPEGKYWEIRDKTERLVSRMDKEPGVLWRAHKYLSRPRGRDINIISEWLCQNVSDAPTALVTLDGPLSEVARRNSEIVGDWRADGVSSQYLWYSLYHQHKTDFNTDMRRQGLIIERKPEYAQK